MGSFKTSNIIAQKLAKIIAKNLCYYLQQNIKKRNFALTTLKTI